MTQYAKAIAGALTPLVVAAIVWLFDNAGIDVKPDNEAVSAAVLAAVTAFFVWLTRNTEKPAEPEA